MDIELKFRTGASAAVLLGALGLLSVPMTAEAGLVPGACPAQNADGGSAQDSRVPDSVMDNGDGTWGYTFRLCNISANFGLLPDGSESSGQQIRDWELPFFGSDLDTDNEAGITNIFFPEGWDVSLEMIGDPESSTGWEGDARWQDPLDEFYDSRYTDHDYVLHFYTGCLEGTEIGCSSVAPGDEASSFFGFSANYGPTNAPYQASWVDVPVRTGDPRFPGGVVPASPSAPAAIPEPGTALLTALGLGLLGARGRKRAAKREE